METTKLLTELNGHVVRAQRALAQYRPPDSRISERELIAELVAILDSRALISLQDDIAAAAQRPAFFADA